jgi:glycosyltransferase involved in cell wall biosynthesis
MAAGRPVVLAIDGVIREVVEDAGAGIYASAGDAAAIAKAILDLADDPQAGRQMGLRGRQSIEQRFDRAALAEDLARLMEKMRAERRGK